MNLQSPAATKLRIFFPGFDPQQQTVPLAHVCGLGNRPHGDYVFVRQNSLHELSVQAREFFDRAETIDEADLVVYPHMYTDSTATKAAEDLARRRDLPCVFFRNDDRPPPATVRYGVVLQEGIYASRRVASEHPHPAVIDDLLVGRELTLRGHYERPTVSFCGYLGRSLAKDLLWRWLNWHERYSGAILRRQAIRQCERHPLLETRFDVKRFGRSTGREVLRERYIQSIIDSDYVLCIRGRGNWSYRLYETLCLGRIPVFLNTDCLLPVRDEIDWKKQCVWIEPNDFHRIPNRILEFHQSHAQDSFQALQRMNRSIWETLLAPVAFWRRTLSQIIRQKKLATCHVTQGMAPIV